MTSYMSKDEGNIGFSVHDSFKRFLKQRKMGVHRCLETEHFTTTKVLAPIVTELNLGVINYPALKE